MIPKRCNNCGKHHSTAVVNALLPGWFYMHNLTTGEDLLLCPECKAAAKGG